jgi:uncharacterized membrane protein
MASSIYAALFRLMGVFCHQMPERSLFIDGVQLPLCIRCTAITVGALVAAGYILSRRPLPGSKVCILFAVPLGLDLALQTMGVFGGSNTLRAITGLSFGFFFLIGSLKWLAGIAARRDEGPSILVSWPRSSSPS